MSSPRKRREGKFRRLEERERQLQDRGRRIDVRNRKNKEEDNDFLEQLDELAVDDSSDLNSPWEEKEPEAENNSIQETEETIDSTHDEDVTEGQTHLVKKKKKK